MQSICNEIIVVDSNSSDNTVALAKHWRKNLSSILFGHGIQKNVGLAYASLWIFSLDADERITPELAEEIQTVDLDNTPFEAL